MVLPPVSTSSAMYLDPTDIRPRSLFDAKLPDPRALAAGAAAALIVHVAIPGTILAVLGLFALAGVTLVAEPERPEPVIDDVVQARFVQLG